MACKCESICRKDGKQVKDDYENLKAEAKVLNQIIERLQGLEGSNSELQSETERLKYVLFYTSSFPMQPSTHIMPSANKVILLEAHHTLSLHAACCLSFGTYALCQMCCHS